MNCLPGNQSIRKRTFTLIAVWLITIAALLAWNIKVAESDREKKALNTARSFYSLVAGIWDAGHNRISASSPPTSQTRSHSQEINVDKDMITSHADSIFMAQLLSEISSLNDGITIHIASLKPSKHKYKANDWEKKALKAFEKGKSEYGYFAKNNTKLSYHYMAPLFTSGKCLTCHNEQGYKAGDIQGGISIIIPENSQFVSWPLLCSHLIAALAGIALFTFFIRQLCSANDQMELLESRDSLTGVANRRFFQEYLGREWRRAKRNGTDLSLIMCDLDSFKPYNKTYGHRAGDNCLSQVAATITSSLKRPADFIARYGGVKFAIILPETPITGAEKLGTDILKLVEDLKIEHLPSTTSKYVTISIGITDNATLSSPREIIADAQKAVSQAKKEGKNRVVCLPHHEIKKPTEDTSTEL